MKALFRGRACLKELDHWGACPWDCILFWAPLLCGLAPWCKQLCPTEHATTMMSLPHHTHSSGVNWNLQNYDPRWIFPTFTLFPWVFYTAMNSLTKTDVKLLELVCEYRRHHYSGVSHRNLSENWIIRFPLNWLLCFLFCCYDKILWPQNLRQKGSQFHITLHHYGKVRQQELGVASYVTSTVKSIEQRHNACMVVYSSLFLLLYSSGSPA